MNCNCAFRLGRAPALDDRDIDTPMVTVSEVNTIMAVAMTKTWVECGRVQGTISTRLYGPQSATLSGEEKVHIAEDCATRLDKIFAEKAKVMFLTSWP